MSIKKYVCFRNVGEFPNGKYILNKDHQRELNQANTQIAELQDKLKRCAEAGLDVAADQFLKLREANAQIVALRGALEDALNSLRASRKDIGEMLQVAKYNLNGEVCGEIHQKPESPQLIHEAGIKASESVMEAVRLSILHVRKALSSPAPAVVPLEDTDGLLMTASHYQAQNGEEGLA